ncbi:hypothetical protein [Paenibacillus sp. NPDC055715]
MGRDHCNKKMSEKPSSKISKIIKIELLKCILRLRLAIAIYVFKARTTRGVEKTAIDPDSVMEIENINETVWRLLKNDSLNTVMENASNEKDSVNKGDLDISIV